MSSRFHNKWHRYNHHTTPITGIADSAYDPIASHEEPFRGDFVIDPTIGGSISSRYIETNEVTPFSGSWVSFPCNVYITNLSAVSATVHYQDILVTELSGFVVRGVDTDISIPITPPEAGVNNLTLYQVGVSSNSWATFNGDLQTKRDLYVSGVGNFGSISIAGCLSADCIHSKTLGASISVHDTFDMQGNSITNVASASIGFNDIEATSFGSADVKKWKSTYTTVSSMSAKWENAYATTNALSAKWDSSYDTTNALSGKWDSSYDTTNALSGKWDSSYDTTNALSGKWDSSYATTNALSGKWDSVYNTVCATSATWGASYISGALLPVFDTRYVNVTGDVITGELYINNTLYVTNLSALSATIDRVNIKEYEFDDLTINGNLYVSGFEKMGGDIDMNGHSITNIGNNSLSFENGATISSNVYGDLDLNTIGTSAFNPQTNIGTRSYTISTVSTSAMEVPSRVTINNNLVSKQSDGIYFGSDRINHTKELTNVGETWVAKDSSRIWLGIDMSADGKYQSAIDNASYQIYISQDYGNTWVATGPVIVNNWTSICVSSDGKYQSACAWGDKIYTSSDYGNTWVTRDSNRDWSSICMSSDGKYQSAVDFDGQIYVSSDYGNNWIGVSSSRRWQNIDMSSDGKYQIACVDALDGRVYISSDYGNNWTVTATSLGSWYGVCMSSDGKYQSATLYGSKIYTSSDYGNTWSAKDSNRVWTSICMSSDGKYQSAIADQLYISIDYGNNWVAKDSARTWKSICMSSDGKYQSACCNSDQIYTCVADEVHRGNIDMQGNSIVNIGNNSLTFESSASIKSDSDQRIRLDSYSYAESITTGTSAFGQYSHAEGNNTQAIGNDSHAEGDGTTAGLSAHAEGVGTTASGTGSHAEGVSTTASGNFGSHAEGESTTASGLASHAEGNSTTASGWYSHAEGINTTASDTLTDGGVHAEGYGTNASAQGAHSEGIATTASGIASHAEGSNTSATNIAAHSEGYYTLASGINGSHAEGSNTRATGSGAHAEGLSSIAVGVASHAEGYSSLAAGDYSHAQGRQCFAGAYMYKNGTYTDATSSILFSNVDASPLYFATNAGEVVDIYTLNGANYGKLNTFTTIVCSICSDSTNTEIVLDNPLGSDYTAVVLHNVYATTATEPLIDHSHAEGRFTIAYNRHAHAEGSETLAVGYATHAEGDRTTAAGNYGSHAEGLLTKALGQSSHAEGYNTKAEGDSSHAEGSNTIAYDTNAHAEGSNSHAIGDSSHAEGGSTAIGTLAHSEGSGTIAEGSYSHSEGYRTYAYGSSSHTEGRETSAIGNESHAAGSFAIANDNNSWIWSNGGADNFTQVSTTNSNQFFVSATNGIVLGGNISAYGILDMKGNPTINNPVANPVFASAMQFDQDKVYQSYLLTTPITCTFVSAGSYIGKTIVAEISGNSTLTFASQFKKLSTTSYVTTASNYLYFNYIGNNKVLYTISQEQV